MVNVKISDQSKSLPEVSSEWIRSTISKNRVMGKRNSVQISIESDNATIQLFANSDQGTEKPSNDIESRITFLWDKLVLSNHEVEPDALYNFLGRMDEWVSYIPKEQE